MGHTTAMSLAAGLFAFAAHAQPVRVVNNPATGVDDVWRVDPTPMVWIRGDTPPVDDLYRVSSGLLFDDGTLVVADGAMRILVYEATGRLVRSLGRRGSGPGEFQDIGWLQRTRADTFLAFDPRLRRVSVLTTGAFARVVSPGRENGGGPAPTIFGAFADRTFLGGIRAMAPTPATGSGIVRPAVTLFRYDTDGRRMDSLGVAPGDEVMVVQGVIARPSFLRQTRFLVGPTSFLVAPADSFAVTEYGIDGAPARHILKAHRPVPVQRGTATGLPTSFSSPAVA